MRPDPDIERPGKAAHVAREIEADVIRRGWPVGATLGSEAALQQQYGVSRSVLREAVRLLEHHQVAHMRRGPGGGLLVAAPDAAPATRAVVIYLEYLGVTIEEVLSAKTVLEPLAAGLAARRIDETGIARLRAAPGDTFHTVVAELTDNPVLAVFIDVLVQLTSRRARETHVSQEKLTRAADRLSADQAAITEAITAGDAAAAQTLTGEHIAAVSAWLQRHHRPVRRRVPSGDKLAEVVAGAIHDDIAERGWPIGQLVGSEADLLVRYGVSRSVLREAVRILEHHHIARMRRGPGGGLFVAEPVAQPSIDTVALYLDYRKPSRGDLGLVREAIEADNVARVVSRRAEPDVAAFLAGQNPEDGRDPRQAGLAEFYFHTDLAEVAGNRVLSLYVRILVELFRRHWGSTRQPLPGPEDAAEVHRAHARIVEAIAAGDAGMARHRCRRHLEALSSWWW